MNWEEYDREIARHAIAHIQQRTAIAKERFCSICYPVTEPLEEQLVDFQHFWNYLTERYHAVQYTGYTIVALSLYIRLIREDLQQENTYISDRTVDILTRLLLSCQFSRRDEDLKDIIFEIFQLTHRTNYFLQGVTLPLLRQVQRDIQRYHTNHTTLTDPSTNQPVQQPRMATDQQIQQILQGILGVNGANLTGVTAALDAARAALENQTNALAPGEKTTVKLESFSGAEEDDPLEWLENFDRTATVNRWNDAGRKVAIAGAHMKGAAADWFEGIKATIGNHYNQNNNNADNTFVVQFKKRFANETVKTQWYHDLTNLRQGTDESVDSYANKFQKLVSRVDLTDAAQQKRMFLMGLLSAYTPLVYARNPNTLAEAIEYARTVEIGYNYASGSKAKSKSTKTTSSKAVANEEIDELTKKLEQLSINYANLSTALMAQTQYPKRRNFQSNQMKTTRIDRVDSYRNSRNRPITCFNCGKEGHISRECRAPRKKTRFEEPRALNYVEYDEDGYYQEYDTEDEEEETYEAYVTTRSRSTPYPSGAVSKNRRPKQSESRKEEELLFDTSSTPMEEDVIIEPETESEPEPTPAPIKKKGGRPKADPNAPKKPRRKMMPAPIESLTEFQVASYLQDLPCGLTVGQAAHAIPKYRSGLIKAVRRSREKEANMVETEGEITTAARCSIRIGGKVVSAIVDSGAAISIITKSLLNRLGYKVQRPSRLVIATANGAKTRSLGESETIPITIGRMKLPTVFQVLESKDDVIILGNNWLRNVNAVLDWQNNTLSLRQNNYHIQVPIIFTRTSPLQAEEEESETESESEGDDIDLYEVGVYYSDISLSDESDIEFNPWQDYRAPVYSQENPEDNEDEEINDEEETNVNPNEINPAIFLAEVEEPSDEAIAFKAFKMGPLEYHQQKRLDLLLEDFADIAASSQTEIGQTTKIQHAIHTGEATPIAQKPYRTNPENQLFLKNEIKRMLEAKIIRPSSSPWASPVVIVGKKGGDKRLCIDYRKLNAVTKVDAYPLPRIDDLLDQLGGAQWFSTLDLASGYWQVTMHPESVEKTAFITPNGLYEFLVMPFGLNNAPGTFQRLMNWVLRDFLGIFVAVYLDDVIIYTKGSYEQHLDHLQQVFILLREANLKIKLKKCSLCFPSLSFLGYTVGRGGIHTDPEKIQKIKDFPIPTSLRTLRAALGLFGYYRRFIRDFGRIAKPMTNLLKKDQPFDWGEKQQNAFERLKDCLMKAPILRYPDFELPFILYTDASSTGLGAVLAQKQEGRECVISYASRATNKSEANYSITDLECLAVVWGIQHYHHYLCRPFKVVTDHSALKWLKTSKLPKGRRARWIMELQQHEFTMEHRAGKTNANADALSRMYETEVLMVEINELSSTDEGVYMDNMDHHTFKRRRLENGGLEVAAEKWITDGSAEESKPNDEDERIIWTKQDKGKAKAVSPLVYLCCGEVVCTCSYSDPVDWGDYTKSYREYHFNELIKSQEEIILETETEMEENINGWGRIKTEMPTPNDYAEDDWGTSYPDSEPDTKSNKGDDVIYTVAYTFTRREFEDMYRSHIRVRQVIAGQPITRGGSKCDDYCDIENHHVHTYCKACQRNLPYGTVVHNCKIGLEPGKIHPDMDPNYLVNRPWWTEPPRVQMENFCHFIKLLLKFLKVQASNNDNYILTPEEVAADLD